MPTTVKFDPTVIQAQAQIIPDATPTNDGVMTKEQAALLAQLGNIPPPPPGQKRAQFNFRTTDDTLQLAGSFAMAPNSGSCAGSVVAVALNDDGSIGTWNLITVSTRADGSSITDLDIREGGGGPQFSTGGMNSCNFELSTDGLSLTFMVSGLPANGINWQIIYITNELAA
jgi:hypothetical protein